MRGTASPLVLASASPRRLDLLNQIGLPPDITDPPTVDENPRRREQPQKLAKRLALEKATIIAARHDNAFVLGADTVVACGRRILPKAETEDQARKCLKILSGRRHRVWGGIAIVTPGGKSATRLVCTVVAFKQLTEAEIAAYIASGEWHDKAGGYAIQGRAAAFIRQISGSYSNVVGLPLYETAMLLRGLGYPANPCPSSP